MMSQTSPRAAKWGPTLVINIVALSLGGYLALVYHSAATRRLLAEYVFPSHSAQPHIWRFCCHLCPCAASLWKLDSQVKYQNPSGFCMRTA